MNCISDKMTSRNLEIIPVQKIGSFLRTRIGEEIILEFQESGGNNMTVEIPGVLEKRNVVGREGYYLRNTDVQIPAKEVEGIFYSKSNGVKSTGIVLSTKYPHILKIENGRLYI